VRKIKKKEIRGEKEIKRITDSNVENFYSKKKRMIEIERVMSGGLVLIHEGTHLRVVAIEHVRLGGNLERSPVDSPVQRIGMNLLVFASVVSVDTEKERKKRVN